VGAGLGVFGPVLAAVLVLGAGFVVLTLDRPVLALACVVVVQVLSPLYLVVALPPPIPLLPLSVVPLAVFCAVVGLDAMLDPKPKAFGISGRRLAIAYFVFGLVLLFSLTDPASTRDSLNYWIRLSLIPFAAFLATVRTVRSLSDIELLLQALVIAGVCAAVYAVIEFILGRNPVLEALLRIVPGTTAEIMETYYVPLRDYATLYRAFSFFITPIELGTCMGMIFPICVVQAMSATTFRAKFLYGCAAVVCAIAAILSFSRASILSLILTAIGLSVVFKPLRRPLVGGVVTLAVSLAMTWPWVGDKLMGRLQDADNVTIRLKLWRIGAHVFMDNPFFGVGLSNFPSYQVAYANRYRIGPIYEFGGNLEKITTADNGYIQLAAETGLVGITAFVAMLSIFFAMLHRISRNQRRRGENGLAIAIGSCVFAYLVNGLTMNMVSFYIVTLLFALMLAFAVVIDRDTPRESLN
jgi:O-antigen ligase